jgi:hypothetical protein
VEAAGRWRPGAFQGEAAVLRGGGLDGDRVDAAGERVVVRAGRGAGQQQVEDHEKEGYASHTLRL